jgi:transcriptional regulator with XRE-family HTH domain
LAKKLGKSQNWISKLEKGETRVNDEIIDRIAWVLDLEKEMLLLNPHSSKLINNTDFKKLLTQFNQMQNDISEIKNILFNITKDQ